MEKYNFKMVVLILVLILMTSGCCKFLCKSDIITQPVEVKIPVYSCPAPKVFVRPIFPEVQFISPLDEAVIIGLDETNYKNNTILYMNLQNYVKELEERLKFYMDNSSKETKDVTK